MGADVLKRIGIVVALATLTVMTGCAADTADRQTRLSSLDLIGLWKVTEADGADTETWLAINAGWLTVWTPCSALSLSWVSDGAQFRIGSWGGSGPCVDMSTELDAWLTAARGVEPVGDGALRLLDSVGDHVALLTRDTAPDPFDFGENGMQQVEVPVVDADAITAETDPPALDAGLEPVDEETISGRWVPVDYEGSGDPYVQFDVDAGYLVSDGCNEASGPLLVADDGRVRVGRYGAATDIGCDNIDLPARVELTVRAGVDPQTDELVLFDRGGEELVRLVRA